MIDILLIIILVICVVTDIRSRKIYNKVIFPALLVTFMYHLVNGGWETLFHSFLGFLIGLALLFIPYVFGGIGAGDVKLMALIGAMKGATFVFHSFLYTALFGAIIAIGVIFFRSGVLKSIVYYISSLKQGVKMRSGVSRGSLKATYPYGVAIAAGTILCLVLQIQGWNVL